MAYVPGKLGDAPFFTTKASTTTGRRTATYELPFDEKGVAHIDLGRKARVFNIEAVFLSHMFGGGIDQLLALAQGADYTKARDKLIAAIEKPGPKQLVHPSFGRVMVVFRKEDEIKVDESTEDGADMCTVSFTCVESRDPLPPAGPGGLLDAVNAARAAAGASLLQKLVTQGPDFLLQDVTDTLDSVIRTLRIANATISSVLAAPALLSSRLDAISRELDQLIQTPRKLFDAIDAFLESLAASAGRVFDAITNDDIPATLGASKITKNALVLVAPPDPLLHEVGLGNNLTTIPSSIITPTRTTQRENRAAVIIAVKASALANAVGALAEVPPESRTEAQDISTKLARAIVDFADGDVEGVEMDAELYDAMKQLAAALQNYLEGIAGLTANTRIYTTAGPVPVEVLAHRLYGDPERAPEVLARNPHISHGGMIPAQTQLEVLDR